MQITVDNLLYHVSDNIRVRVRVVNGGAYSADNATKLLEKLMAVNLHKMSVDRIYPLYYAQELFIECRL